MTEKNRKALLQRVEEANEVGGCAVQTMGTVFAIARGETNEKPYLLKHSVTDLCKALALRGFDVKAMTPDPEVVSRRIRKFRDMVNRGR